MIPTFAFLSFAFYVSRTFTRTKRQTSTFIESSYSREASVPASGSFFNCLINISTLCDEKERVVCSSTRERHIGFARARDTGSLRYAARRRVVGRRVVVPEREARALLHRGERPREIGFREIRSPKRGRAGEHRRRFGEAAKARLEGRSERCSRGV